MADRLVEVSVDALLRQLVREAVRDELREQLAPVRASLEALAAASPPALLDVETFAARVDLSPATIRRQAAAGVLPARRVGRKWLIDAAAVRSTTPEHIAELAAEARR
jgi:excisionase family DNA binding protein